MPSAPDTTRKRCAGRTKLPPADRLGDVARATGKTVAWLFEESEAGESLAVPLFDEVPAGPTSEAVQAVRGTAHVPARWLRGRGEVYCLRVRGRSMEPLLLEGDVIAVRRQSDADSGQVVVVGLPGEAEAGDWWASSETSETGRASVVLLKVEFSRLPP